MAEPGDEELLHAWCAGDAAAGDRLIRRHFSAVFRFFRAKLPSQAEDLSQRTFLGCVESASRFRHDGSFRAFLFAIARNQLYNSLRKQERTRRVFDPAAVSAASLGDPGWRSLSGLLADAEAEALLLQALRALALDHQIALELYYWERLSVHEIAEALEIAPGTVKSRLGRARALLREELERRATSPAAVEQTMSNLERWASDLRDRLDSSVPKGESS
jgi:RNA polymerase sigma-70 factor (ECF subfamily)